MKRKTVERKTLALRLPEKLYEEIREEAAIRGASVNETIVRLLREALQEE